ncbi:MAG: restriction endonuclease [Phycisphaeraceae bacterium]|nr:restriction endonuclease [Phycisphaeraceae bacterium]
MMTAPWRLFEQAVASFLKALDPSATVIWNAHVPDHHHGRRRQRDVLIRTKACGHFALEILVSCKRYERALHTTDIEHFHGELSSSTAQMGVIYSHSGFNALALDKAKALGIKCCRLYNDQPPDIPDAIFLPAYLAIPTLQLVALGPVCEWGIETWEDVFSQRASETEESVAERWSQMLEKAMRHPERSTGSPPLLPQPRLLRTELVDPTGRRPAAMVGVQLRWLYYSGKQTAYRVNGSYELTSRHFAGSQFGPVIDTVNPPGPGWDPISPEDAARVRTGMVCSFGNDAAAICQSLLESRGSTPVVGTAEYLPRQPVDPS